MSYYILLKDINKMECLECGRRLCGTRRSTMKRHYKLVHKKIVGNSFSVDDPQTVSDDETNDNDDENSLKMEVADPVHYKEIPQQNENDNEDALTIPKGEIPEIVRTLSDQGMPPYKKNSPTVNQNKTYKNGKYDWLGDLIVAQIEDIDSTNRADFVWDVQSLVRKYLVKPAKLPNKEPQSSRTSGSETTATQTNDVTFKKGSNVSFNINFV